MMPADLVTALSLSLAIAFSWRRFSEIFSRSNDAAFLRSPATTLASALSIASIGLAFSNNQIKAGVLVVTTGLLLAILLQRSVARDAIRLTVGTFCLLTYVHLSGRF